jgi:hypothetical protein
MLHEKNGVGRWRLIALGGVAFVVEADARQINRRDGREELAGRDDPVGHVELAKEIAAHFAGGPIGLEGSVGGAGGGKMADETHGIGE